MDALSPWRAAAARHGFLPLERNVYLRDNTFLDLVARDGSLSHLALRTWLDTPDARYVLTTYGAPRTLLRRLLFALSKNAPVALQKPEDVEKLMDRHFAALLPIAAKQVRPEGDPLAWRQAQERHDKAQRQ